MKQTPTVSELSAPDEVDYPSGDGQPMAETELHFWIMLALAEMLRERFQDRPDVHVAGNVFLYYEKGNPEKRRSPDIMVVKGVEDGQRYRDSFKVWQEKAVPCVVIELTSRGTADEDMGPKKELYEQLGVREYYLFDPRSEYLPRQLVGYRLVKVAEGNGDNGTEVRQQYEELPPAADGSLPSAELGLRLVPRGQELDLVDAVSGERLTPPQELAARAADYRLAAERAEEELAKAQRAAERAEKQRQEAEKQRQEAEKQRQEAEKQRQEAEKQKEEAERRAKRAEKDQQDLAERAENERRLREELEAEIARLRAALPPAAGDSPAG